METTEWIIGLPYGSTLDVRGKVRMGPQTAENTDAVLHLANERPNSKIFLPGEFTFGPERQSTSSLMRDQLIKKGIEPDRIHITEGKNNTEEQIQSAVEEGITNAAAVGLDFHLTRASDLMAEYGLNGTTESAENLILKNHKGATVKRLERMAATDKRFLGMSKVYFFERIARVATKLGKPGRKVFYGLRSAIGKGGPTVTELHFVDSAKAFIPYHEKQVKKYQEREQRRQEKQLIALSLNS